MNWGANFGFKLTSTNDRLAMMTFNRTMIKSTLRGETPLELFMQKLSGEAASQIISAIVSSGRYVGIMNLPNAGQIAGLPRDAIVETYGTIDATGAYAITFGDLPPAVHALVDRHVRGQEMTVSAALTGNQSLVLQALLNDSLTSRLPVDQMESMLDKLLTANKAYLPLFS
jgi:alpha-galactosidase